MAAPAPATNGSEQPVSKIELKDEVPEIISCGIEISLDNGGGGDADTVSSKRKSTEQAGPQPKKRKKLRQPPLPKTALGVLNELRPGLVYQFDGQQGPTHCAVFSYTVEIDGLKFTGHGRSKQLAKQATAEIVLTKKFVQHPDMAAAAFVCGKTYGIPNFDFTIDRMDTSDDTFKDFDETGEKIVVKEKPANWPEGWPAPGIVYPSLDTATTKLMTPELKRMASAIKASMAPPPPKPAAAPLAPADAALARLKKMLGKTDQDKNPIQLLNEYHTGLPYELVGEKVSNNDRLFTMKVSVDGKDFEGTGPSKKIAKANCARAALRVLFDINLDNKDKRNTGSTMIANAHCGNEMEIIQTETSGDTLPQEWADHIAKAVLMKFDSLVKEQPSYAKRKVLAGIVATLGTDLNESFVVGVGTGTKCISGEHLSVNGTALNDCHAEVIARRCLVDFLYDQLERVINHKSSERTILTLGENGRTYKLKEEVKLHLYISTAPCGDARIFSPHESETGGDKHPNRKGRGKLRTKIESGEGTIPVTSDTGIQTWDGVMQGQRLNTMSCSDKLCRWNMIGVQGALLSYFLEPIYLESIVLGGLFHSSHLQRALGGRIAKAISGLSPPYRPGIPSLCCVTSAERRQASKAPTESLSWTCGRPVPEVVNAMTGKTGLNSSSRISKRNFFERFTRVAFGLMEMAPNIYNFAPQATYHDAKQGALEYQTVKSKVNEAFKAANLGSWVTKPLEQDQFDLSNPEQDIEVLYIANPGANGAKGMQPINPNAPTAKAANVGSWKNI